ncbi:MAG: transcription antitermination factor NusB [Gammaproteobacteria bacterium]|nr:transcription antitermination factor NusB [Gammaproteobacteria bacterium]
MNARSLARSCVVQALYQWQMTRQVPDASDVEFILAKDQGRLDRAYFTELLNEIITNVGMLSAHLEPVLDRPLEELDPVGRAILWLGVCELVLHHEIPFRVVINEAIEQAKVFGVQNGHKYVNGILDTLAQQLRVTELKSPGVTNKPPKS